MKNGMSTKDEKLLAITIMLEQGINGFGPALHYLRLSSSLIVIMSSIKHKRALFYKLYLHYADINTFRYINFYQF